ASGRNQRHLARTSELNLSGSDLGAFAEQRLILPRAEAPLDESGRLLHALVPALHAREHLDQAASIFLCGPGEAVARLVGVACLQSVGARDMAENRISILLGDVLARSKRLAPGEVRQRIILLVELGVLLDRRSGD